MIGFPRHQDFRRQELVLHRLESLLAFFGPHKLESLLDQSEGVLTYSRWGG